MSTNAELQPSDPQWIPVSERLPGDVVPHKNRDALVVLLADGAVDLAGFFPLDLLGPWVRWRDAEPLKVTHWMDSPIRGIKHDQLIPDGRMADHGPWIPVSECLPQLGQWVLIHQGPADAPPREAIGSLMSREPRSWVKSDGGFISSPSHWMPLPESPA